VSVVQVIVAEVALVTDAATALTTGAAGSVVKLASAEMAGWPIWSWPCTWKW